MRIGDLHEERETGWVEFIIVTPLILVGFIARLVWYGLLTGWYMHKVKWW